MSDQPPQYPTTPEYQQPQQQYPQYPPQPPPKKGGIGKWIALGGCGCFFFIAVLAGVGFFVYQLTKAPMQAVNDQLAALRNGEVDRAYNDCSVEFKKQTSLEQFQQFVQAYPLFKTSKEFSSHDRKTENGVTTLDGNVETSDGSQHPVEYKVIKESGVYKIHYIHVKESAPAQEQSTTQNDESQQQQQQEPSSEETPSGTSTPEIFDIKIDKSQSGQMVTVTVAFQVRNFLSTRTGNQYNIHLVQDLETMGPDGNKRGDLSQDGIKTLEESGPSEYTSANFSNTLSIPASFPAGTYTVHLRIHDQLGGGSGEESSTFEFP